MTEGTPELVNGSRTDASQMNPEFGESHLDRIEVW